MLKGLTNTFRNNCNSTELTYNEYLVLDGTTIPIKAELNDDVYENGNFIGTFILKKIEFETDATYDFKNKEFEYYKVVNGESIKMGTFISTDITINDTTELVKVIGMDYGLKAQIQYTSVLDYTSGNITLLDVWNECCELSGLESGINDFVNSDFIVDSDQFTGTGATIRDVFKGIAMCSGTFVKVMNDDKVYLIFKEQTGDIIEDYVELEDKRDTHPWTCLRLGMSNVEGENVDYKDEELIEQYGENWLILNDNPFAYTQEKRQQLIMGIFDQIKEFGYSAFVSKTSFKPYLTTGDLVQFRNRNGDLVNSIVLRYQHNGEEITLEAPSETSATVNYVYPLSAIEIAKRTELIVNKDDQTIQAIIQKTQEDEERIENLLATIEGLQNTLTTSGGTNLLKDSMGVLNDGSWLKENDDKAEMVSINYPNSVGQSAIVVNDVLFKQEVKCKNGIFTLSFNYEKVAPMGNLTLVINDEEHIISNQAMEENITQFMKTFAIETNEIEVSFVGDVETTGYIYDLILNEGLDKKEWEQNQDETTTDTVKIGKGIEVSSTSQNTTSRMDADGFRIISNQNNQEVLYATDKGIVTRELTSTSNSNINGLMFIKIGSQVWMTGVDD